MPSTHVPKRTVAIVDADDEPLEVERQENPNPDVQPYCYAPLPRGDYFRLLQLLPDAPGSSLRCTLEAYDLDAYVLPPYSALSYTWNASKYDRLVVAGRRVTLDDPRRVEFDMRHPLYCEGRRLLISTNLRDALRRIRRRWLPVKLWVDAVCINQEDDEERGSQIMLMPRIYHQSKPVLLWIGESDEDTHEAFKMVRRLADARRRRLASNRVGTAANLDDLEIPPLGSPSFGAFARLFGRPVFRRIWCVQEAVVAPEVEIRCGGEPFPRAPLTYDDLADACRLVTEVGWTGSLQAMYLDGEDVMFYPPTVWVARSGWLFGTVQPYSLAYQMRNFYATDARDKIFAILGLLEDHSHRGLHELSGAADEDGIECRDGHASDCRHARDATRNWAENKWEESGGLESLWRAANSRIISLGRDLCECLRQVLRLLEALSRYCQEHEALSKADDTSLDSERGRQQKTLFEMRAEVDAKQIGLRRFLDGMTNQHVSSDELVSYRFASGALHATSEVYEAMFELFADGLLGTDAAPFPVEVLDIVRPYYQMVAKEGPWASPGSSSAGDISEIACGDDRTGIHKGDEAHVNDKAEDDGDAERGEMKGRHGSSGEQDDDGEWPNRASRSEAHLEIQRIAGLEYMRPRTVPENPIITSAEMQPWSATLQVLPDYSLSAAQVFRNFTARCILKDQSLDILSSVDAFADDSRRQMDLPSWVPDFAVPLRQRISPLIQPNSRMNSKWCADGDKMPEIHWDPASPDILKLSGCVVDTIAAASMLRRNGCGLRSVHEEVMDMMEMELSSTSATKGAASNLEDDENEAYRRMWKSEIGMPDAEIPPPPAGPLPSWPFMMRSLLTWYHPDSTRADGLTKKRWQCYFAFLALLLAQQKNLGAAKDDEAEAFLEDANALPGAALTQAKRGLFGVMRSVVAGRRLVFTDGGHFIWAPETAEEGDFVCIFKGGKMPFVIRQTEGQGKYRFVGECFAFMMVFGQAAEDLEDDDWSPISLA